MPSAQGVVNPQFGLLRCSPLSQLKGALGSHEHPFRGRGHEVLMLFVFKQDASDFSSGKKRPLQRSPP